MPEMWYNKEIYNLPFKQTQTPRNRTWRRCYGTCLLSDSDRKKAEKKGRLQTSAFENQNMWRTIFSRILKAVLEGVKSECEARMNTRA
jgi:hypothetical protein